MPKCILSGQVKSTFTQEQADGRYIQMTNGATTTLASSLQVSGINNIEFTEEGEESITASNVSYSNTTSGMTSGNVQNAIDELFQSVSEGKSLIAAAVTDKGVETAATDSFATMAGNIGQISSGGGNEAEIVSVQFSANNDETFYYTGSNGSGEQVHLIWGEPAKSVEAIAGTVVVAISKYESGWSIAPNSARLFVEKSSDEGTACAVALAQEGLTVVATNY